MDLDLMHEVNMSPAVDTYGAGFGCCICVVSFRVIESGARSELHVVFTLNNL